MQQLQNQLENAKKQHQQYQAELDERRACLRYIGLGEETLFDTATIIRLLKGKQSELDEEIRKLTLQEAALSNELSGLKSGKTIDIPEALVRVVESLGIQIVTGMTWLKQNGLSEEKNRDIVEKHPFVPYAMIMTERELSALLASDERVYISSPIPIITRETLASDVDNRGAQETGVHFYMLFNQTLLNAEHLAETIRQVEARLSLKADELDRRREERDTYRSRQQTIEKQKVTANDYQSILRMIEQVKADLSSWQEHLSKEKSSQAEMEAEKKQLEQSIETLRSNLEVLPRQLQDLSELQSAYQKYIADKARLRQCTDLIRKLEKKKSEQERNLTELGNDIIRLRVDNNEMQHRRDDIHQHQSRFLHYADQEPIALPVSLAMMELPELEGRYRAITERVAGQIRDKEKAVERIQRDVQKADLELQRKAKEYGFSGTAAWETYHYSDLKWEQTKERAKSSETRIQLLTEQRSEEDKQTAICQTNINNTIQKMQEACGTSKPMPRESVQFRDICAEIKLIWHEIDQRNVSVKSLSEKAETYRSACDLLGECIQGDFVIANVEPWDEDITSWSNEAIRFLSRIA